MNETEDVYGRYQYQGAVQSVYVLEAAQAPDDLNAVELVTVDGSAHHEHGPGVPAVNDLHRQPERRVGVKVGRFQVETPPLAGRDLVAGKLNLSVSGATSCQLASSC